MTSAQEVFICNVPGCGKVFNTVMSLRGHQGFHANVGSYPCEICKAEGVERVFSLPQGLGSHLRLRHQIGGEGKRADANRRYYQKRKAVSEQVAGLEELELGLANEPLAPPSANGSSSLSKEILAAFEPLIARYQQLQGRSRELVSESEQVSRDLHELWALLGEAALKLGVPLTPPETQAGVQVAFSKRVSDSLKARGEEWLSLRRNSFTSSDLARGLGIAPSTATTVVGELRDEGKVRLVGHRGRAQSFVSTIHAS